MNEKTKTWNLVYKKHKVKIIKKSYLMDQWNNYWSVPEYDVYIEGQRKTFGNIYTKAYAEKIAKKMINEGRWGLGH